MVTQALKEKIPAGWKKAPLKELGLFIMGQSPKGNTYNRKKEGLPLLNGAADLSSEGIIINQYTTQPTKIAKKGDILFCIRATIGNINLADREYCLGRGVAAFRVHDSVVDKSFIIQVLDSQFTRMRSLSQGGVIKGLKKDELEDFELLIPATIKEEEKIAEILATVEENMKETDKIIAACGRIKKGLLRTFFNKESYARMTIKKFDEVLVKLKRGHSLATNADGRGVRYLTSGNLLDDEVNLKEKKYLDTDKSLDNCLLKKNDILINCVNSLEKLGKVAIFEGADEPIVVGFNNFGLEFKNFVDPQYAKYFCLSDDFQKTLMSISKPAVQQVSFSGNDLLKLNFYYLDLKEQKRISSTLVSIDERIKSEKSKNKALQINKQVLMQKLLSGEIRVKV